MHDTSTPIGVLLMAYGGPDSLDDVEPYLLDIRGGRPPASRGAGSTPEPGWRRSFPGLRWYAPLAAAHKRGGGAHGQGRD